MYIVGDDVIDMTTPHSNFNYGLNMIINGEAGNDVCGQPGGDTITSGDGEDILFEKCNDITGGAVRTSLNLRLVQETIIKDYNKSDGDIIRFFLHGSDTTNLTISGSDTISWESASGTETIKLEGVTLSSLVM